MEIQTGENAYRIISDVRQEGELADYGTPAFLVSGMNLYVAFLDSETAPFEELDTDKIHVYRLNSIPTTVDAVEFDLTSEEGSEDDDDDADAGNGDGNGVDGDEHTGGSNNGPGTED